MTVESKHNFLRPYKILVFELPCQVPNNAYYHV
jgi:hypothetical protein